MLGIITAMPIEAREIVDYFHLKEKRHPRLKIYANQKIILTISGVGKINAAIKTTDLLQSFLKIKNLLNYGWAGSLYDDLQVGDLIFGSSVYQYDTYVPHKFKKNKLSEVIQLNYPDNFSLRSGKIMSGDRFVDSVIEREKLRQLGGLACDMECFSEAQAARHFDSDFTSLKFISDLVSKEVFTVCKEKAKTPDLVFDIIAKLVSAA